jgi:hypothetical protein
VTISTVGAAQSKPQPATSTNETVGKYVVLDNLNFQLFHKNWSAKEELLLLQGIMKCGMGNWIDISEQYVKSKDAEQCESHYFTFYYKNKENNIPTEEQDVLILGQREIKKTPEVSINVPLDNKKAAQAEIRVNNYVDIRKQEINEEELELQKRNQ